MDTIIVAFESQDSISRICSMLEHGGLFASMVCRSGAEAIRAAKKNRSSIIICGYKLCDMSADTLAYTLGENAMVLVVARPAHLNMCEEESIFKLAMPVSKSDLLASLSMLSQFYQKHLKISRSKYDEERQLLINRAKEILMDKNHMTEEQAHKFIQKKSMDSGSRLEDTARLIIGAY